MIKKIYYIAFVIFSFMSVSVFADSFVVRNIEIDGLQRIPQQTVMEYLPVKPGQAFDTSNTNAVIQALYQTGFFSNVVLGKKGDTLVVQVTERPTIGLIKISGNKQIKSDDLLSGLKKAGIAEGSGYDPALLDGMKQALIEEYRKRGRYAASIDVVANEQSRNRMSVQVTINEGKVAKVQKIHIIGNNAFKEKELLSDFTLGKKPFWAFFSDKDQYSEEKLDADLKTLQDFYLDHGYLRFKVDSKDVDMTPDKRSVVVTIHITEGQPYHISGYTLSGDMLGQEKTISDFITVKKGEIFSRQKIVDIDSKIGRFYGDQGYAMAQVNADPQIDDANNQVFLNFKVEPGQRVYIRKVTYSGNERTTDTVLRRETRQMEGGAYSVSQQDETKRRLNNLGYLENVDSQITPVPGRSDQVDLNYKVKDASSTTASVQLGYSDAYGLLYGANVTEQNFKGTGKTVGLGFNNSQSAQSYNFTYFDPYYTDSGISRGFNLYFQKFSPNQASVTSYTLDAYGGMMNYRLPMSEYDYLSFGYGYEYLNLRANDSSQQIYDFITQEGSNFNNTKVTMGWTHSTFDRAIFPTRGYNHWLGVEAGLPVLPKSLDYYRASYDGSFYQPIGKGVIVNLNADLGYGNGYGNMSSLPFFKNFYAGGMGTVRGYSANALGPKDSLNNALGGNVLTSAEFNLIFPNPISEKHLRTSVFFDAGNVFQNTVSLTDIRYSTGVEADYLSPMGLIKLSLGKALNSKPGDDLQAFNFSVGTSF